MLRSPSSLRQISVIAASGILLSLCSVVFPQPHPQGGKTQKLSIQTDRQNLWEQYERRRTQINQEVQQGRLSPEQGGAATRVANEEALAAARARGKVFDQELEALMKRAEQIRNEQMQAEFTGARTPTKKTLTPGRDVVFPWEGYKNTGTPLNDPKSRGVFARIVWATVIFSNSPRK